MLSYSMSDLSKLSYEEQIALALALSREAEAQKSNRSSSSSSSHSSSSTSSIENDPRLTQILDEVFAELDQSKTKKQSSSSSSNSSSSGSTSKTKRKFTDSSNNNHNNTTKKTRYTHSSSSSTFFEPHEKTKKDRSKQTVPGIRAVASVNLSGTTVEGDVNAGSSIKVTNVTVEGSLKAGSSITATNTTANAFKAAFKAGSSITATNTTANAFKAGSSITITNTTATSLDAGSSVKVYNCKQIGTIKAGGSVTLHRSQVSGNVSAGNDATVENSEIFGKLTCSSIHLIIKDSHIDTIYLRRQNSGMLQGRDSTLPRTPQVIELINSTVKNVIFEGGNGKVLLVGTSKIPDGITGGEIQNTNNHGRSSSSNSQPEAPKEGSIALLVPEEIAQRKDYMKDKNFLNLCQFFITKKKQQEKDIGGAAAEKLLFKVFEIKAGDKANADLKTAGRQLKKLIHIDKAKVLEIKDKKSLEFLKDLYEFFDYYYGIATKR